MFFPFDSELIGYQEVVTLKTSDLPIPIFNFPKGSFFVDGTYAKIKGTNKILRPGIDYLVLSCNETIPFSSNPQQNEMLKQAYVRNAILLRTNEVMDLEWHVAYCGGEETTKANEYNNYINQQYNTARTAGTTNLLLTPHQAWGGLISFDNTQVVSGKHIYSKPFRVSEELEAGGGLGWGKVELAVQAIAESVTHGGDPAIIDAFFNWSKHNEIEFNKRKTEISNTLNGKINDLDGKRVGIDQFMFKEEAGTVGSMHVVEHHNVMLRGLDPIQSGEFIDDPIFTNRKTVGFYGLAKTGFDVSTVGAKLYQRVAAPITKVRHGAVFAKTLYDAGTIDYRLIKEAGAITTGTHTLYVVSKNLGVIHTRDVTAALQNPLAIDVRYTFGYSTTNIDFSLDTITCYILDGNKQGDFSWVGNSRVVINNVRYGFELDAINRGNLLGPDVEEEIDNVTMQYEIVVRRTYSINAATITLRAKIAETGAIVTLNSLSSIAVAFAAGETEKRILVTLTNSAQIKDKQMLMFFVGTDLTTIIASVLVGLKSVGRQDYAQISLLDNKGNPVYAIDTNNTYMLKVQFSRDSDYFTSDLQLALTKLLGTTATAQLGTKSIVSNSVITYPIAFSGTLDAIISLGLTDINNAVFKTNLLNVAYNTANVNSTSPIFNTIVNGKHLRITRDEDQYILDFAIVVKDHSLGGYVFNLSSNKADLVIPNSVISNNGLVCFKATIPVNKLVTGTTRLTFVRAGQNYPLDFTIDIARLIAIEIEYRDGAYSDKALETSRAFRLMLTNPFTDRRLVITRDSFAPVLGITDIIYGGGLTDIVVADLTLEPGERKQLTVGDWVSIEDIKSNSALYTRYAPNCNVSQVLLSNSSVAKAGSYLTEVGEIVINKEDYVVEAVNILTGNALYDRGMTENYIDVITQFDADISNVKSVAVVTTDNYVAAIRNTIISPIDKTIIVALTVKRNDSSPIDYGSIFIGIDFRDINSQVVHKVSTSVDGN